ncbi:glycosyltransferase family 4 protein [bacterium]|nr:glycosyltransferase family 4 protein [candidate division CSSED10-310 bacterium]
MKFAIDARRIRSGMSGLGVYACCLLSNLAQIAKDHEITAYVLPGSEAFLPVPRPWEHRIPVPWAPDDHVRGEIWKHFRCPADLQRRKIELFHDTAFQLPLIGTGIKSVVTIHDLAPFRMPETNSVKYNLYWRFMIRHSIRAADRIITHSHFVKEEIIERFGVSPDRIDPVYLAPHARFIPGSPDPDILARRNIHRPYVLMTANLEPRKNLVRFLKAFARLTEERSVSHNLVIAGAFGWKYDPIRRVLDHLRLNERVIFTGYLPDQDLVHIVRGSDLVAVPSLYEGFGLPVLEGMACGKPVAVSRASSLSEVAGDCAVYFDPLDPESMAAALYSVLTDRGLRERLAGRGFIRSASFSWIKTARDTLDTYLKTFQR